MRLTNTLFKYIPEWYHVQKTGGSYFKKQNLFFLTRYYRNIGWATRKNAYNRFHYFLKGENYFFKRNSNLKRDYNRSRIAAACEEHNFKYKYLVSTLPKLNVFLNLSSLARLSIYEPRSFRALIDVCRNMVIHDLEPSNFNPNNLEMDVPANQTTRNDNTCRGKKAISNARSSDIQ